MMMEVYSCLDCAKTATMEEKLVVTVAGYLELYNFTNRNYHNINKKQQVWRKVSEAMMSGKLLS